MGSNAADGPLAPVAEVIAMSNTLMRIVFAVAMLFALPFVYMFTFMVLDPVSGIRDEHALILGAVVTGLCVLCGWLAIWGWQVRWTPLRIGFTVLAVPAAGVPATIAAVASAYLIRYGGEEMAAVFAVVFWILSWIVLTALVWRETYRERVVRLGKAWCPHCGGDMRGKHETTCAQCGRKYTLDELFTLIERGVRPARGDDQWRNRGESAGVAGAEEPDLTRFGQ